MMMKKINNEQLRQLKLSANSKLNALRKPQAGTFKPTNLNFKGYWELLITIDSLLAVCILASQNEEYDRAKLVPKEHIGKCLELAKDLLPYEEGAFLDEAYQLFQDTEE